MLQSDHATRKTPGRRRPRRAAPCRPSPRPSLSTGASPSPGRRTRDPEEVLAAAPDLIPAPVPGTAATALRAAGRWDGKAPLVLHDKDVWYLAHLPEGGAFRLDLDGLATLAEVWHRGARLLSTANLFRRFAVDLPEAAAGDVLAIAFRALAPALSARGPRARWKAPMIPNQGLRLVRTTLFGHMPGWTPAIDAVGPTRAARLVRTDSDAGPSDVRIATRLHGTTGALSVSLALPGRATASLVCAGRRVALTREGDRLSATLDIPDVALWWPATHGEPMLHTVDVETADGAHRLAKVGFRRITRDSDARGFGLRVNGVPVFCRGAVWTSADVAGLSATRESYEPFLRRAAEAGMNMVRVGGTMIPEAEAFFDLCDALGLMVWQEFPFANFDYPVSDAAFAEAVTAEARDLLGRIGAAPSLTVLCGGSEVTQQAAMMGLPPERWPGPLFDAILPKVAAEFRPDVPYVPNSPSGGPLPFVPNAGVAHYYGVGAYMRPLEDARRAEVTFAAECLAFSNVPDAETLATHLPVPAVHDPRWKATVPRDLSASWDFEDVREHYLGLLFGVDPARLRREDPALHLDLSRAVTGLVMEATFAEWRRGRSPTRGALVWTLMDLVPGAGWGVIDSMGRPKPAWYALKRAFRPVQVTLTDEGTNGLAIHLLNERPAPVRATLDLVCLKDGRTPVVSRKRPVVLPPRSAEELSAFEVIGAFFDVSYAYRFGPPGHDVTLARLTDEEDGRLLSEFTHHPLGLAHACPRPEIRTRVEDDTLVLATDGYAPIVHVEAGPRLPDDDWFSLAPGIEKRVRLVGEGPVGGEVTTPGGRVRVGFSGSGPSPS